MTADTGSRDRQLDNSELQRLLAGLRAVRDGDFRTRLQRAGDPFMDEIAAVFNEMADQLALFTSEVTRVNREVGTDGKLGGHVGVSAMSGTWKDLTDSVNAMADSLTGQVRDIANVATAVAQGDLTRKITVGAKGEMLELKNTINTMVNQLSAFADEVTRVAREVGTKGILGGQANVPNVAGTWKDLTDNVNSMANNLTSQVRNIAQVTTAVAEGDLSKKIDVDARGEILALKTTINTMVDQLSAFAAEVTRVAREVGSEGRLGGQAEVEGVSGTWKRLTENVNELAGNLTRQVRAIAEVTSAVSTGDLTRSISVEARGEVAELKNNVNAMVESLRETIRANQEQNWLKTNLAQVSGMMQGHRDLAGVAELIMGELVPMVGAQHGTFFIAGNTGDDTRLRLIAGYALRADKEAPSQFRLGQSLIGQVAKTKRPIVVEDAPADYVKITSSLGEAAPINLFVLPILFEDQVLGVIELGSFTRFTPLQKAFIEQLTEIIGVNVNTIITNSRTDALLAESQRLAGELQAQQEELRLSNVDLEEKAALLARQNRDIEVKNAEIERARQEIEERAHQLALASKYKSQFLANMSHELRTPLNSMLILARLLAQNASRNLTPKQVEYANVIHSAGADLLQLINDILDLSKIEAGRMDIHQEVFSLSGLLEEIQSTFRPLTAEKGLEFTVTSAPGVPVSLVTDKQRLRQVLGNLLSNAIKFTEHGRVELNVSTAEPTDATRALVFSVIDTGIGISPHNLKTIFGAFQQGDGTMSRRYGGTGLGLSIAREVAALLGGEIEADSELGRGSTFTLRMPYPPQGGPQGVPRDGAEGAGIVRADRGQATTDQRAPATNEPTAATAGLPAEHAPADRRVLVLEHQRDGVLTVLARDAATEIADFHGPTQIVAVSEPEQAMRELAAGAYRWIILDLNLPDAAAFAFLEELEGKPGLSAVPVLAYTSPALAGPQGRLARLRFAARRLELLPSLDELRERIALHLSTPVQHVPPLAVEQTAAGPSTVTDIARHESLSGKKVLVVEDDLRNVFAISSILELYGLTVIHAPNGRMGLRLLKDAEAPDLVVMDVMMPEMDGYATMSAIRQMPRFARLPIIAVTARAMQGDREKSLAAGASDHVTKPVDAEELLSCMERLLTGSGEGEAPAS